MEINRAKEIVSALAEGIDPTTGELLPEDSIYNKGDIVRALYAVLSALDAKKPKRKLPKNAGKAWSKEDDDLLIDLYRSGASKKDICNTFKRTITGIAARLVRLGEIESRDVFRDRK